MSCLKLLPLLLFAVLKTLAKAETIHERHEYAYSLIQEIFDNYPEYINKLLEYHTEVKKFNMKNETYRGFIRQMRRKNKYELLIADAYTYNFKNKVYESGRHPNTVLYQCDKAIRYSSGNPMYCEYIEGSHDSNIILVSGHGGELKPDSIPDRGAGCWVNNSCLYQHGCQDIENGIWQDAQKCGVVDNADVTTSKITRWVADELLRISGKRPHLIINNLHRNKIDMNREMPLATFDVPEANQAWRDYHELIETAKANFNGKRGLLLDIHGNDLNEQWNMFGYGLDSQTLNDGNYRPSDSNIRSIGEYVTVPFKDLIRGKNSIGHFMQKQGIKSIPSLDYKSPGTRTYFPGAYTVDTHGSRKKGHVDSIMVEIYTKYRDDENGKNFARALATSVDKYYKLNYINRGNYADYYADIKGDKMQDSYYSKSKGNVQNSQEENSSNNEDVKSQNENYFKNMMENNNGNDLTSSDGNGKESASNNYRENETGSNSKQSEEYTPHVSSYNSYNANDDTANQSSDQRNETMFYSNKQNNAPDGYNYGTVSSNQQQGENTLYHNSNAGSGGSENTVNYSPNTNRNDSASNANSYYYFGHLQRPSYNQVYRKSSRKRNGTDTP